MYKILKLDEDKWTKFEFIHYYPGKFSLFLIFIGPSGVATQTDQYRHVVLHVNEVLSPSAVNHGRGTLVKRECFKPL